jgi:hypothetical protein
MEVKLHAFLNLILGKDNWQLHSPAVYPQRESPRDNRLGRLQSWFGYRSELKNFCF